MRHAFVVTLALALPALPSLAGAQQQVVPVQPMPPSVVATGQAEVKVTPDRATVMVAVETRGKTAAAAAAENARITRVTLDALRAQKIPNEQLGTADYNVYPEQTWNQQTQKPVITGYVARNTIRAEVRDVTKVGDAIDAALAGGATTIQGINFWSSNLQVARREGLQKAVANACMDAAAIARGSGRLIGGPLELSGNDMMSGPQPMPMMAMAKRSDMAENVQTPINPGEQTLTVTVMTRWELLSGVDATNARVASCAK